jgi:hypothetical protein
VFDTGSETNIDFAGLDLVGDLPSVSEIQWVGDDVEISGW